MADIVIDLNAEMIPPTRRVWRIMPGDNYSFLQDFEEQSVIFLDTPNLELPSEAVSHQTPDLDARILASRRIARWAEETQRAARLNRSSGAGPEPSRRFSSYRNRALPTSAQNLKGAIVALFGKVQRGDLVVVPCQIGTRRVLIGVVRSSPATRATTRLPNRYGPEAIPSRRVRWLRAIDERTISPGLSAILRRPNVMSEIDQSRYHEVFARAYGTYHYNGISAARISTNGRDFTSEDNLNLSILMKLSSLIANDPDHISNIKALSSVIDADLSGADELALNININSPGDFIIRSAGIAPLVLSVLLVLLTLDPVKARGQTAPRSVVIENAGAMIDGEDPCTPNVDASVRRALALMHYDVWRRACERTRDLNRGPQIEGDSRLTETETPAGSPNGRRP